MSLQLVLPGLYPPVNHRQKWHLELAWQRFDVTFAPRAQDGLLELFWCTRLVTFSFL